MVVWWYRYRWRSWGFLLLVLLLMKPQTCCQNLSKFFVTWSCSSWFSHVSLKRGKNTSVINYWVYGQISGLSRFLYFRGFHKKYVIQSYLSKISSRWKIKMDTWFSCDCMSLSDTICKGWQGCQPLHVETTTWRSLSWMSATKLGGELIYSRLSELDCLGNSAWWLDRLPGVYTSYPTRYFLKKK